MLEIDELTDEGAPRLLRDKSIRHYRLFPFELRKIKPERAAGDSPPPDPEEELYEFSICSDGGIERYDWWTGDTFLEVLSLEPGALISDYLDAGASVLLNHKVGQLVGRTKSWRIDGETRGKRKIRAAMRFSPLDMPQGVKREVDAEIRGFTSVGYEVLAWEQTKKGDRDKGERDEFTITSWRIFEWSFVDIPADISVGDGRSRARFRGLAGYDDGRPVTEDERTMDPKTTPAGGGGGAAPSAVIEVNHDEAVKAERERASQINELGRVHSLQAEAEAAVRSGTSVDAFRGEVLKAIATRGLPQKPAETALEIPKEIQKRYSYVGAVLKHLDAKRGRGKFDGPEREVHDELRKHVPVNYASRDGVMVPLVLDYDAYIRRQERALDSKTGGKGAELVVEQVGELIELLVNRTRVIQMGATVLTGLSAPIAYPKQSGGMTFYWMGENPAAAVPASDISLGLSLLTPRTIMGKGSYSRQLMILGNRSVEQMFRREIAGGHARAIDRAALHGKGAAGEPQGIYQTPGISTQAMGGVPTYGKLVDMTSDVADKNADDGALGFITTPKMAGKLKQVLVASAAGSEMCWMGAIRDGLLVGERATSTGQMSKTMSTLADAGGSEHGIAYGNYADVIFGSFAGLEITVDEITLLDYAMLKIVSFGMEDILVKHAESFSCATGATLT